MKKQIGRGEPVSEKNEEIKIHREDLEMRNEKKIFEINRARSMGNEEHALFLSMSAEQAKALHRVVRPEIRALRN